MAYCRMGRDCDVYLCWAGAYQFHVSVHRARELGYVGETDFNVETPEEAASQLETLRQIGFRVPEYALDRLWCEIAEADRVD